MRLADSGVLVAGASRGLGRALSIALAEKGARLALLARDGVELEKTAALCRQAGAPQVLALVADITQRDDCQRAVDETLHSLGGLDVLIANAGLSMWAAFDQVRDLTVFERLIEVNYLGAVYLLHASLAHLRAHRGRIVAISSAQAWTGMPYHTGYAAAKAALQSFLDSLAMEIGDEVHMMGVYPGWIRGTDLRASALGADGQPLGASKRSHSRLSVTPEECSRAIVRGLERDSRMVFVPRYARLLYLLRPVAYPLIQRVLYRAAHSQKHTSG